VRYRPLVSEQIVAILRETFDRFQATAVPDFDVLDPAIEVINFDTFPVTQPYYGWDGVGAWLVDMSEPFDDFRFELGKVLAHDDKRVVVTFRVRGKSRMGGPDFELVWGGIVSFHDRKIVRVQGFRTAEEALATAGLTSDRVAS